MLKNKKVKSILFHFFILLIILIIILGNHIYNVFGAIDLKQIFYHLEIPFKKTSGNFISVGFYYVMPRYLIVTVIYLTILYIYSKIEISFTFRKRKKINLNNFIKKNSWILFLIFFLISFVLLNKYFLIF